MTNLTRFEIARIVGARSLQIGMGAPALIPFSHGWLDPVEVAWEEYQRGRVPITIRRR